MSGLAYILNQISVLLMLASWADWISWQTSQHKLSLHSLGLFTGLHLLQTGWLRDKAVSVMENEFILLNLLTQAIREQQALHVKLTWPIMKKAVQTVALFIRDNFCLIKS